MLAMTYSLVDHVSNKLDYAVPTLGADRGDYLDTSWRLALISLSCHFCAVHYSYGTVLYLPYQLGM